MTTCGCVNSATCGCSLISDPIGTTAIVGTGSLSDPFIISATDPPYTRPAAKSTRVTTQSIPNDTLTAVIFTAETFDLDNMINIAGQPTRLTITTHGIYFIGGTVQWAQPANGGRLTLVLRRNGLTIERTENQRSRLFVMSQAVDGLFSCEAGDYFELMVQQLMNIAPGALNLDPTAILTNSGSSTPIAFYGIRMGAR